MERFLRRGRFRLGREIEALQVRAHERELRKERGRQRLLASEQQQRAAVARGKSDQATESSEVVTTAPNFFVRPLNSEGLVRATYGLSASPQNWVSAVQNQV